MGYHSVYKLPSQCLVEVKCVAHSAKRLIKHDLYFLMESYRTANHINAMGQLLTMFSSILPTSFRKWLRRTSITVLSQLHVESCSFQRGRMLEDEYTSGHQEVHSTVSVGYSREADLQVP